MECTDTLKRHSTVRGMQQAFYTSFVYYSNSPEFMLLMYILSSGKVLQTKVKNLENHCGITTPKQTYTYSEDIAGCAQGLLLVLS